MSGHHELFTIQHRLLSKLQHIKHDNGTWAHFSFTSSFVRSIETKDEVSPCQQIPGPVFLSSWWKWWCSWLSSSQQQLFQHIFWQFESPWITTWINKWIKVKLQLITSLHKERALGWVFFLAQFWTQVRHLKQLIADKKVIQLSSTGELSVFDLIARPFLFFSFALLPLPKSGPVIPSIN